MMSHDSENSKKPKESDIQTDQFSASIDKGASSKEGTRLMLRLVVVLARERKIRHVLLVCRGRTSDSAGILLRLVSLRDNHPQTEENIETRE
jgi:predicted acetyltransferase